MMNAYELGRSFRWLNATQFLGALNDNVFKLLLINFLIAAAAGPTAGGIAGLASLLFALPFLLFTPLAGELADRFSKRDIVVATKVLEIAVMLAGAVAFWVGNPWLLLGVLFLMSVQSALFGPAKYGIIPELVPRDAISRANGQLVMMTYLAIILGTVLGPQLAHWLDGRYAWASVACVVIAVAGTLTSFLIGRTPAGGRPVHPTMLFWQGATRILREFRGDRHLIVAMYGYAYFSVVGAFLQAAIIQYGMERLGYTSVQATALFLYAALGIAAGGWLAGRWSGRNIEFGIVPLGALLIAGSTAWLALGAQSLLGVAVGLSLAGVGSGLYVVPLEAFLQWRSPVERRGEIVATGGFLSWVGVFLGALLCTLVLGVLKWKAAHGFLLLSGLTLALGVYSLKVLPDFFIRFVVMLLTRVVYRLRALGLSNLPVEGGALLVANHVSFMDALQILAVQQRRIRFMMHRSIYEGSRLKPLFKLMGIIPIAMEDPPKKIVESLREARRCLDEGYLVCIFAEGALTRTGLMRGFKPGFERIVRDSRHPIIPVYIGGTWGSIFSHYYGHQDLRMPSQFPYPVTVMFGAPMPPDSKATDVRQAVMELACIYFEERKSQHVSLGATFIGTARRHWSEPALDDTSGRELTWGHTLAGALALARVLKRRTAGQDKVGILLPPSVGGALVNIALTLQRKVAVNLNFTASAEAFRSSIQQAGLQTIISSRAFVEKFPQFAELPGLVMAEDLRAELGSLARLRALVAARLFPVCWLTPMRRVSADDVATIIFSSGTTGEPKGVMLSHHNIASNVEGYHMVMRATDRDRLCATLPLFHSFGFTCGIWYPALAGIKVSFHTSPLDAGKVAEVVRTRKCTALFVTPTFLLAYLRKATREDFATLRVVVVGAEKLKPRLADAFEERFGVRPLEGYGATELSPVAALSVPHVEVDGIYQVGHKEGAVGQPIPGVAARVVDPDSGAPLPVGQSGLLLIKGPNVMVGYLNKPELTREVLVDGWYRTGDIAHVDEDGFITISDRLARFSKIGGEMVPHLAIEEAYLKGLNTNEAVLAVTSIACDRRGERLIVLHTEAAGDAQSLHALIEKSELPNLWKPDRTSYCRIEALPLTGSGKLDVKALRQLALAAQA
jgi:acyl-[acyl-carrier-protein]-phospholipid O-acyltransferase/long-chain-fatty-acid--[acyl-carrier-protein] ligase